MSQCVRERLHIQVAAIFSSQISNLNEPWKWNSIGRRSAHQRGPPPREASMFATLRLFGRGRLPHAGDGCRRHHASPAIPSEPPPLACPTPQGRVAAAEKGVPSLWWARASPTPSTAPAMRPPGSRASRPPDDSVARTRGRIPTRPESRGELPSLLGPRVDSG